MREPGEDDDIEDGPMVPLGEALRMYADAVRLGLVERGPPDRRPHWEQARDALVTEHRLALDRVFGLGVFASSWSKWRPSAVADQIVIGLRAVWRRRRDMYLAALACRTAEDFDNYWRNR